MKIQRIFLAAAVSLLLCTACNPIASTDSATEPSPPPKDLQADRQYTFDLNSVKENSDMNTDDNINYFIGRAPVAPHTACITDEMYAGATNYAAPDLSRLAAVMKRAAGGEDITVAVIGGSITQGSITSSQDKAYASIMKTWWEENFPESNITLINAGIGGTDSYLGVHRCDRQLLDFNPDFVIVEFSVNDSATPFYKTSYDNLVRRILKQDNMPAVLLLFMTQEDGTSADTNDALIGFGYGLPMLSYKAAVLDEIKNGRFAWKDISPDNIHPNDYGHAICGELIWKYLNEVYKTVPEITTAPAPFEKAPATRDIYSSATILDNTLIEPSDNTGFEKGNADWSVFKNGWSSANGGKLSFNVDAANIGILYYQTLISEYTAADIFVDGIKVKTLVGYDNATWGNHGVAESVFSSKEKAGHTVEIIVNNGSFDIFGLLVS